MSASKALAARTLEAILLAAKSLANADGGTLYRVTDDNRLKFEILHIHWLVFANVTQNVT